MTKDYVTPEEEWTKPFFTTTYGFDCMLCHQMIKCGDFIQRPRVPRHRLGADKAENQQAAHYDCEDPQFDEGMKIAVEDRKAEDLRVAMSYTKGAVDQHFRNHGEGRRR